MTAQTAARPLRIALVAVDHPLEALSGAVRVVAAAQEIPAEVIVTREPYALLDADLMILAASGAPTQLQAGGLDATLARVLDDRLAGDREVLVVGDAMGWLFDQFGDLEGCGQWPGTADAVPLQGLFRIREDEANEREHAFSELSAESVMGHSQCAARVWELEADGPIAAPQLLRAEVQGEEIVLAVDNGPLKAVAVDLGLCNEIGLTILDTVFAAARRS